MGLLQGRLFESYSWFLFKNQLQQSNFGLLTADKARARSVLRSSYVCRWPEQGWVAELRVWVRSPVSLLYVMNVGESLVVSKGPKKLLCGWRAWTPTSTVCWSSQRFHPGQLGPHSVLHLDRVLVLRSHKTWHVSLSNVLKFVFLAQIAWRHLVFFYT